MSATVSSDAAYMLKHLDEIQGGHRKRKQNLLVKYDDNESLDGENHLTQQETQSQPTVEVENVDDKTYRTLIMVDPDAPNRDDAVKGPVLHWLVANFQGQDLRDGQTLYAYKRPTPPSGSGPHRYIFFLYQSIDQIAEKKLESEQRLRFPRQKYVTDDHLGFLDTTYFTVDN